MSGRVEAVAKLIATRDYPGYIEDEDFATKVLIIADAVMFSDEAIERAALISGHAPSVVRAIAKALKEEAGYE